MDTPTTQDRLGIVGFFIGAALVFPLLIKVAVYVGVTYIRYLDWVLG
jgi:hypothetical protein